MASKNDITGDSIKSRLPSQNYEDNYDRIFKKEKTNRKQNNVEGTDATSTESMEHKET